MRKKAKKYITVPFAVMMCTALFFVTALARAEVTPESDPGSYSSSVSAPSSSSKASSGPENSPSSSDDGNGNVDAPSEEETVPVKLDYNDGSAIKIVNEKPGTQVKNLTVPSRKGYVFDYWTMNGARVSSTFEIYSEITLTAQWEESTASSRKPSSYASVDTHRQEVEQAASQAEGAVSDPDVLSSQDWNSILSTGQQSSSGDQTASLQASSAAQGGGGGSWLFPVGIALIVLSACGVGAFVYLQFFSGPGPRGPGSGSETDDSDGMEFTDISSSSTGPYPAPPPGSPQAPQETPGSSDDTKPVPPQARRRSERDGHEISRSQAKPVGGEKKDFDWDKFFNDNI